MFRAMRHELMRRLYAKTYNVLQGRRAGEPVRREHVCAPDAADSLWGAPWGSAGSCGHAPSRHLRHQGARAARDWHALQSRVLGSTPAFGSAKSPPPTPRRRRVDPGPHVGAGRSGAADGGVEGLASARMGRIWRHLEASGGRSRAEAGRPHAGTLSCAGRGLRCSWPFWLDTCVADEVRLQQAFVDFYKQSWVPAPRGGS